MIGVDIGLNVGSIIQVRTRADRTVVVRNNLVIRGNRVEGERDFDRIKRLAIRYVKEIKRMAKPGETVAIEEPLFSWGRKNPKGFAKSIMLFTLIQLGLTGYPIEEVNAKTAKKMAGHGSNDKKAMIKAYKSRTGNLPGHSAKYGQETLADAFFIAISGMEARRTKPS